MSSEVTSANLCRSYRRAPKGAREAKTHKDNPPGICHLCMCGTREGSWEDLSLAWFSDVFSIRLPSDPVILKNQISNPGQGFIDAQSWVMQGMLQRGSSKKRDALRSQVHGMRSLRGHSCGMKSRLAALSGFIELTFGTPSTLALARVGWLHVSDWHNTLCERAP